MMYSLPPVRAAARSGVRSVLMFLSVLALLGGPWSGSTRALAQDPTDPSGLEVRVATDRPGYAPGDPVRITVSVTNGTAQRRLLTFPSSLVADYALDGRWRWSEGRGFATVITTVPVGPGETWTFPTFIHRPADYHLPVGRHEVTGIVPGYGRASTVIVVGAGDEPPPGLLLTPHIAPNPAPYGAPVSLAVTVTNVSRQPMSFGHDGCPVLFVVDGHWSPPVACAEYWREIELAPGQSMRFSAPDFPYLDLQGREINSILTPGVHSIEFEIPGVGRTAARLQVVGGGGAISGIVMGADGSLRPSVIVQGYLYAPTGNSDTPPNTGHGLFQAKTDDEGRYRLENLPAGLYYVNASSDYSAPTWYPGVPTRDQSTPIAVAEGSVVDDIDFVLGAGEPPPPPPAIIVARVFEALPPGSAACCPLPLHDAVVAAIPVVDRRDDTESSPPGDSTGTDPDPATGRGGELPPDWPENPAAPVYYGFADSLGDALLRLPYGRYRLVAFTQSHQYQWWEMTSRWEDSRILEVSATRELPPPVRFDLAPFDQNRAARATVAGQVFGHRSGDHDEPPPPGGSRTLEHPDILVPLARAEVVARPLVQDPRIVWFAPLLYPAVAGDDGRYSVDVPANVPYLAQSWARGWHSQYYDRAATERAARPVDVSPGARTEPIDFVLAPATRPHDTGSISGAVYRSGNADPLGQSLAYPAAGAVVRIRHAGPGGGPAERVVRAGEDGRFFVDGLPTAADGSLRYVVSAEDESGLPTYFPEEHRWQDATPVAPSTTREDGHPIRLVLSAPAPEGPHFLVGLIRAGLNAGDTPVENTPRPGGETVGGAPVWPLIGAYLYLVPADDPRAKPVAAGVACDNGTLLIHRLPAGRYRAYADHPGFATGWFLGASPAESAVITVGDGGTTPLVDIVLVPVSTPPPDGGEADLATPRMLTELRNTPNPFRPQTTIVYRLMTPAPVTVQVFDLNGRLVRTLADGVRQVAGEQHLPWDGRDDTGRLSGAGIYFFRVWTPVETRTGKMVMLR